MNGNLMPRPDSLETFMMIMPMGFNSERAGDMRAVLQFNFSGEVDGPATSRSRMERSRPKKGPQETRSNY